MHREGVANELHLEVTDELMSCEDEKGRRPWAGTTVAGGGGWRGEVARSPEGAPEGPREAQPGPTRQNRESAEHESAEPRVLSTRVHREGG